MRKTLFLVDWDDTLFASTYLSKLTSSDDEFASRDILEKFKALELRVSNFLTRAILLGKVLLVTNAAVGWVELCCSRFFPNVLPLLQHVKIVSARSKFEALYPLQPGSWKLAAFREELCLESTSTSFALNVISIGDSHYERDAVLVAAAEQEFALIKSVKFLDQPELAELNSQLELLHESMTDIVQHETNLDLILSRTQQQSIIQT